MYQLTYVCTMYFFHTRKYCQAYSGYLGPKQLLGSLPQLLHSPMDKLQLTGQKLGQSFNSKCGCMYATQLCSYEEKQPNLKL
jgi:hypothetical protein